MRGIVVMSFTCRTPSFLLAQPCYFIYNGIQNSTPSRLEHRVTDSILANILFTSHQKCRNCVFRSHLQRCRSINFHGFGWLYCNCMLYRLCLPQKPYDLNLQRDTKISPQGFREHRVPDSILSSIFCLLLQKCQKFVLTFALHNVANNSHRRKGDGALRNSIYVKILYDAKICNIAASRRCYYQNSPFGVRWRCVTWFRYRHLCLPQINHMWFYLQRAG